MHTALARKPDTEADFKARAAEWVAGAICELRRFIVFNPKDTEATSALRSLEDVAGAHTPRRSALCGRCHGCLSRIQSVH